MHNAPRIVVVEDNPADVALLRRALDDQSQSFDFVVIDDGEKALRFIEAQRFDSSPTPCVILLDLHLPRIDGTMVLHALSQEPSLAHVQVLVWTTLASPAERENALRFGPVHYQTKPNSVEGYWEVAAKLLDLCNGRSATAGIT